MLSCRCLGLWAGTEGSRAAAGGGWPAAGTAGTLGCKGHFTKAAKTDSDIGFVLIFHVSTWVSLPLVGSRKLNRCTVLHLQSSFFLHRSMLNVSH